MTPEIRYEIVKQRQAQLRQEAAMTRLAAAFASSRAGLSSRPGRLAIRIPLCPPSLGRRLEWLFVLGARQRSR